MSAGFTPGPWECERVLDPTDAQAPWVGRLAEQRYTAIACGNDVAERMANGRLIAAAPDLLHALEAARCALHGKLLERADAALAKARGAQVSA